MNEENEPSALSFVAIPAVITLGVTILRLLGELKGWSMTFFNASPGGGGAVVGIVWLVPVFGIYFALKLERAALGPERVWRSVGIASLSLLIIPAVGFLSKPLGLGGPATVTLFCLMSILAIWVALRAWPVLGRTLLAYGLAARIPVALVMLFAILGSWGTHYDLPPPGFPSVGPWVKWFLIGLMPQLTLWIAFTIIVGTIFGGLAIAMARYARPGHS